MKLLAVSDVEVGFLYSPMICDKFQDIDLLFSCGDLPYYYVEYMLTMLNIPCYYVRGNHSSAVEYGYSSTRKSPLGAVDLHKRCVEDETGLLVAGLEGCLRYNPGAHQYTQAEYWNMVFYLVPRFFYNKAFLGRYLDIFIAHAPPWQIHDENDLPHRGIKAFRWLINVFQPRYFLHGHIHVYRMDTITQTTIGKTAVVNVFGYKVLPIDTPRVRSWQRK
ncbi:MAG: metallophosphoesterase family protein [Anaerolineaceae bacterium]|nr:metallophosphoesterase family protein [Anaerolineaceae bacterium]